MLDAVLDVEARVVERWRWWRAGRPPPPRTLAEYLARQQAARPVEDVPPIDNYNPKGS
ncbi:hypothetical protein [Streptomyces sp. 184]|uniref:hypothetical protein n=1 Tax=Streptomyces sp. 184 TaxID=1827526 RepID=UPI0038917A05